MNLIDAIDIFIETDATDDSAEGSSLISVRAPQSREFATQIKELGAKWDEPSKEWKLYGNDALILNVANLCRTAFPRLPRRRNRLVALQLSSTYVALPEKIEPVPAARAVKAAKTTKPVAPIVQMQQVEQLVRVQFVVNRTIKTYRLGQSLKWFKEFKEIIELPLEEKLPQNTETDLKKLSPHIQANLPELEQAAVAAFEALMIGQKDAANAILNQAGIQQSTKS